MTSKSDARVSAFRVKHERELRKLVTIGCAVASCSFEGDAETEESEMEAFVKHIMDLVERTRRAPRKHAVAEAVADKVVQLKA